MDDPTDAFARLKRLHVEGVLSDAEYEQEKTALMARSAANANSKQADNWAGGRRLLGGILTSRWWLFVSVAAILLIGTWFFGRAYSLAETRGEVGQEAGTSGTDVVADQGSWLAADSPWTVQTTTDPMTDATVHQATATFEGGQYNIEVAVCCSSGGNISYSATSFDKEGAPAEMRSEIRTYGFNSWAQVPFQMRADDGVALSLVMSNPEYNNQVVLKSGVVQPLFSDGSGGDPAEQMGAASKVVLRLFMTSGEETIEWHQGDAAFRNAVRPCLEQRQTKRDQLSVARQQEEAERKRNDQAYIERLSAESELDLDTIEWMAKNRGVQVSDSAKHAIGSREEAARNSQKAAEEAYEREVRKEAEAYNRELEARSDAARR